MLMEAWRKSKRFERFETAKPNGESSVSPRKLMETGRSRMANTTPYPYSAGTSVAQAQEITSTIAALGHRVLRYGLALVIGWIGVMKFTGYEA
jgi:hypothetical protein